MKKVLLICMLTAVIIGWVSAYTDPLIIPRAGGFGLNMATDFYDFNDANKDLSYLSIANGANESDADEGYYFEDSIIALAEIYNIDASQDSPDPDQPMKITASCPGGFYFTSRSNPDAKRPFEIKVILKASYSDDIDSASESGKTYQKIVTLGTNNEIEIDGVEYPTAQDNVTWPDYEVTWLGRSKNRYRYIWCDLVICLPFDSVTSTGVLSAKGNNYNLIEDDDYSAVVTLTIEYDGKQQILTIPMSGYYSRNPEEINTASLVIRPLPAAMNLNIKDPREFKRVANIDFMAYQTKYEVKENREDYIFWEDIWYTLEIGSTTDKGFHIFLSASNDHTDSSDRGFELVNSKVKYTEPHTPYNSIGYTARLVSDNGSEYMDFDGKDAVVGGNIPGIAIAQTYKETNGSKVWFSEFHGGVEVMIDELSASGDTRMLPGQYTSTIYVHVVGDDA